MPVPVGSRILIADLIRRAEEQGCKLHLSANRLMTPEGFRQIRYLFNLANRARFDLTDYDDDEFMLASEARRLRRQRCRPRLEKACGVFHSSRSCRRNSAAPP